MILTITILFAAAAAVISVSVSSAALFDIATTAAIENSFFAAKTPLIFCEIVASYL